MITEKEFRSCLMEAGTVLNHAAILQLCQEAGFAPGPALPERIDAVNLGGRIYLGVERGLNAGERWPLYKAAAARYNAYPGLRTAAKRVLQEVRRCATQQDYAMAAAELEAELAKGPRP